MSHFNVCILVKRDGSTPEQLKRKANAMLADFDINKMLEPYKFYVENDEIQRMAGHFGIDPTNLPALAEKFEEWNGDKGGVDEAGFYGISTKNPNGHIDAGSVFAEVKPENRGHLLYGGGDEKSCAAIVTPNGTWEMGPWIYGSPNAEQEKELEVWEKKIARLLDEHTDAAAFLADCHI